MPSLVRYLRLFLFVFLSLGLLACNDDSAADIDDDIIIDTDDDDIIIDTDDPIPIPEGGFDMVLVPFMATKAEVDRKGSISLKVMLLSAKGDNMGVGVADEAVKWGISSGSEFVSLRAAQTVTDYDGYASVTLSAKDFAGTATIVAEHPQAPKRVIFQVNVTDLPTGSLRIFANYAGLAPVKNYSIHLFEADDTPCSSFDPAYPPTATALSKVDENMGVFDNLGLEQKFAVVAYGYSASGAMVAAGCLDTGLIVLPKQTTDGLVNLQTIDLNPSSTYHVRSYFDFGDIAKSMGEVGKMVSFVSDFVDNPGKQVYDILFDQVIKPGLGTVLPSWVAGGVGWVLNATGLSAKLQTYLNNLVLENKTGCQVGLFGCQLRSIVRTMELIGELDVQKYGALELRGKNTYSGLAVYWRMNCDGTDPNCGRMPYTVEQLNLGTKVSLLEGSWQGSLSNGYDRVSIESHELSLHYGKILVFMIEKILLPKVANGATNFNDAIANWINCEGVATWLSNTIKVTLIKVFQVDREDALGWCKSTAGALATALNFTSALASAKKVSSNVQISGTAYMHDRSGDNIVDDIDNGAWDGNMTLKNEDGTSTSTAVRGIWSAYNRTNKATGYCSFPKTASDSDDQSCAYPPIDTSTLVINNMCAKYAACAK